MAKRTSHPAQTAEAPGGIEDLTGRRFGRLLVIGLAPKTSRQYKWVCACDCGMFCAPLGFTLKNGDSRSCGCIAAEASKQRWLTPTQEMRKKLSDRATNATHKLSRHPLYKVWSDMKQRCQNSLNKFYDNYGGRGIAVCDRWSSFESFFSDMSPGYTRGLQLGRIDNNGPYSPENCRWETPSQQQNNKSNTVYFDTPDGRMNATEAANRYGLSVACLRYRIEAGWPVEKVFGKKSQRHRRAIK